MFLRVLEGEKPVYQTPFGMAHRRKASSSISNGRNGLDLIFKPMLLSISKVYYFGTTASLLLKPFNSRTLVLAFMSPGPFTVITTNKFDQLRRDYLHR